MYAYIDETGNTGPNLFDQSQPIFASAALITRGNFDILYASRIRASAHQIGSDQLHANLLGVSRIEQIALDLLAVLKKSDSRFFFSRVEKPFLALTKMFDTIFDATENIAVPWHVYNLRPIRILLVFKMAQILTEEVAAQFWSSLMERNKDRSYAQFVGSLRGLLREVTRLPKALTTSDFRSYKLGDSKSRRHLFSYKC
jgi:hypothetical protein